MESREQGTEIVEAAVPLRSLQAAIESIVRGKSGTVRLALVCLLAEGHPLKNHNLKEDNYLTFFEIQGFRTNN